MVFSTGDYTYECGVDSTGNLTVVSTQYTISLCKDCSGKREEFHVTTGDSVQWLVVPDQTSPDLAGCTMTLRRKREEEGSGGGSLVTFPMGECMVKL